MTNEQQTDNLSIAFKALGNPHRLSIVRELLARDLACCAGDRSSDCTLDAASCNVGVIGESLAIDNSTLSHHLKELDHAGLIERARRGRQIYCRVNRERLEELWLFLRPGSESNVVPIGKELNRESKSTHDI